jgi:hypothetical protein
MGNLIASARVDLQQEGSCILEASFGAPGGSSGIFGSGAFGFIGYLEIFCPRTTWIPIRTKISILLGRSLDHYQKSVPLSTQSTDSVLISTSRRFAPSLSQIQMYMPAWFAASIFKDAEKKLRPMFIQWKKIITCS